MMKTLKWIYSNKVTLTGFLALLLYILDEIFNFSGKLHISQEVYYGIATLFFIIVGYAIKGRGFETIEDYKAAVEKILKLKEAKKLEDKVEIIGDIITAQTKQEDSTTAEDKK